MSHVPPTKPRTTGLPENLALVVRGGYCVGCGVCALGQRLGPVQMTWDAFGRFVATARLESHGSRSATTEAVCPFADSAENEDTLAQRLFADAPRKDPSIGRHWETWAGYVAEGDFREKGSSGGMISWLLCELLHTGEVDAVIHTRPRTPEAGDSRLFAYCISRNTEDIRAGAKSHYYPVELSEVLALVREKPGRYALVGLPCFLKAIRLLSLSDPVIKERIRFCIGLFCGHLKSAAFAELFSAHCGIKPEEIQAIDFRQKSVGVPAYFYNVLVTGLQDGRCVQRQANVREVFGGDWGLGFFKYKACDYCDDVVAETADVALGDAWLPMYLNDSRGTNIVIARSKYFVQLIEAAVNAGQLKFERIAASLVVESQAAGFRHRREGLAYRLHLAKKAGQWTPRKRVIPNNCHLDKVRRAIYKERILLAQRSHSTWHNAKMVGGIVVFEELMRVHVAKYRRLYNPKISFANRVRMSLGRLKRRIKKVITKVRDNGLWR